MCSVFVDLLAYWLVSDLRYGLLVQLYGLRGDLSSIQLLSCVRLFVTPWTAAFQASLSITNSWSLLKFMPLSRWCHPTISSSVAPFSSKACHCFHCFPIYFPWSDGTRFMILVFWMLSFNPTFSLSSCTSVKRLFSSSSLSAISVVSSAYLRLLIFLPASWFQLVLPPAQRFSWCILHIS